MVYEPSLPSPRGQASLASQAIVALPSIAGGNASCPSVPTRKVKCAKAEVCQVSIVLLVFLGSS